MPRALALVVVGLVGGLLSGSFGVGGGVVMVPLLIWLVGLDQRHAAATSLVAIVPTAIAGSIGYLVHGQIALIPALLVAVGGVGGSLIGTRLLRTLPIGWLRWMFAVFLVLVALYLLVGPEPHRTNGFELTVGSGVGLVLLGIAMGIASGLFGIGGGVIVVPALIAVFGMSDLAAKGTSLVAVIPAALSGSIRNTRARLVRPLDGIIVGVSATLASLAGVAIAFWLPPRPATILFGVLVLASAVQLMVRAIRRRGE
ncbi:sulfite exporter TauE/SafE family protein [Homoserinibacter sp. GY 40078]|uniref:sulfite exporter TauE/SafE family protein n=1 Tax=Homoserinibacter sp. GY 40078 TaxID=2603275 RepID=UPI0021055AC0|nr:sulfite exporter TauE/SafE family protein [Homoserinibacter sp. GY 40078]